MGVWGGKDEKDWKVCEAPLECCSGEFEGVFEVMRVTRR